MRSDVRVGAAAAALLLLAACASHTPPAVGGAPAWPDMAEPAIPAQLSVPAAVADVFHQGWQRLQAGDTRGAARDFSTTLKRAPGFYPAEAAMGDAALADRQYKQAVDHFQTALKQDDQYLPALAGLVDADLGLGDQVGAIGALEQIVAIDPERAGVRSRLDVLRLRAVEQEMSGGAKALAAGHLDDAQAAYERALAMSPSSPVVLRELASVELARHDVQAAEAHARASVSTDAGDPEALIVLADVLEAGARYREAADALARAVKIDPRPAWRTRAETMKSRADYAALPDDYRAIPMAAAVTRAQAAALLEIKLSALVDRAPRTPMGVITDVRGHWAEPWILPVTRAGIMDVQVNHTFQPDAILTRSDLAHIVTQILNLVAARRPQDAALWRSARPRFSDLAPDHLAYRAAAAAVTAGVMSMDGDRFSPARAVSGPELVAAVARLEQLAAQ
jgi:tetratricopeptide (TPR) repeat protein